MSRRRAFRDLQPLFRQALPQTRVSNIDISYCSLHSEIARATPRVATRNLPPRLCCEPICGRIQLAISVFGSVALPGVREGAY